MAKAPRAWHSPSLQRQVTRVPTLGGARVKDAQRGRTLARKTRVAGAGNQVGGGAGEEIPWKRHGIQGMQHSCYFMIFENTSLRDEVFTVEVS